LLSYQRINLLMAVLFLVAVLGSSPASSGPLEPRDQGLPRIHFGFKGGLALTQHQGIEPRDLEYTVSSTMRRGVAGGVFMILPVTERFGLQQEVLYVRKGSRQEIGADILDVPVTMDVVYDMDYIEIPVLLRYHWLTGDGFGLYSMSGFCFGIKINDRYTLSAVLDDGVEQIPISADNDMSEVDLFDMAFTYGLGIEFPLGGNRFLLEYRFDLSLEALPLPTYAYVPFGEEQVLVDNDPVPLRNQAHMLMVGIRF
jgi:hypothetical protein